jgi:hypothetical protein
LDPDTAALVQRTMKERGLTFKQAVNEAIRRGLGSSQERPSFTTPSISMGTPTIPLDKAVRIAGDLEDDELRRRLATRS